MNDWLQKLENALCSRQGWPVVASSFPLRPLLTVDAPAAPDAVAVSGGCRMGVRNDGLSWDCQHLPSRWLLTMARAGAGCGEMSRMLASQRMSLWALAWPPLPPRLTQPPWAWHLLPPWVTLSPGLDEACSLACPRCVLALPPWVLMPPLCVAPYCGGVASWCAAVVAVSCLPAFPTVLGR